MMTLRERSNNVRSTYANNMLREGVVKIGHFTSVTSVVEANGRLPVSETRCSLYFYLCLFKLGRKGTLRTELWQLYRYFASNFVQNLL